MATLSDPAALLAAIRRIYGWKRLKKPLVTLGKEVHWQRFKATAWSELDASMEYHTNEEHARWVLEKEFGKCPK